jgi:hypothetical protein
MVLPGYYCLVPDCLFHRKRHVEAPRERLRLHQLWAVGLEGSQGRGNHEHAPWEEALSENEIFLVVFSSLSLVGVLAGAAGSAVALLPGILRDHFQTNAIDSYHPVFWIAAFTSLAIVVLTLPIHEKQAAPARPDTAKTKISTRKLIGRLWLTNGINGFFFVTSPQVGYHL